MLSFIKISALACSVCFKDPSSSQTIGLQSAVFVMLGALILVLFSLAKFFYSLKKRSEQTLA